MSATQDAESVIVGGYLNNWHITRSKEGTKRWTPEQATPRIKWWRLKEYTFPKIKFRETVLEKVRPAENKNKNKKFIVDPNTNSYIIQIHEINQ